MISKAIFLLFSLVRFSLAQVVPAPSPTIETDVIPSIIKPSIIKPAIAFPTPSETKPPFNFPPFGEPPFSKPPFSFPPFSEPPFSKPPFSFPPFSEPPFSKPPTISEIFDSHLTCFEGNIAKPDRFKAVIALKANMWQEEYTVNKCQVKTKKVELCVPSTKVIIRTNTTFPEGLEDYPPQILENDFLCYFMKCEETSQLPDGQVAVDQFGVKSMKIMKDKIMKVCVPAWKLDKKGMPINIIPLIPF
jgi:hypothetical protein